MKLPLKSLILTILYIACWGAALTICAYVLDDARHEYDSWDRRDYAEDTGVVQWAHKWDPFRRRRGKTEHVTGNQGHTYIDFGGQYLMGRMLMEGQASNLYNRDAQRIIITEIYPRDDEPPKQEKSDAEQLMDWFMGDDDRHLAAALVAAVPQSDALGALIATASVQLPGPPPPPPPPPPDTEDCDDADTTTAAKPMATPDANATKETKAVADPARIAKFSRIGGPLYPPTHAFLFAPLAQMKPREAYEVAQIFFVLLAIPAGLGIWMLSNGRIWWPVGVIIVACYPNFADAISLAQNPMLTLTILIWGWALVVKNRPVLGGMIWGLLVYKPVWAAAFFLVPVLSRRWRMAIAMAATGGFLAALTLPWVGFTTWRNWLTVGGIASDTYLHDYNWIWLSRDVLTIPRRYLDMSDGAEDLRRENVPVKIIGWAIWGACLAVTCFISWVRPSAVRFTYGAGPTFLLIGAWLACYHFMYYDVELTCLPLVVLFANPRQYLEPVYVTLPRIFKRVADSLGAFSMPEPFGKPKWTAGKIRRWLLNPLEPFFVLALAIIVFVLPSWDICASKMTYPVDTFCIMALWLWCGGKLFFQSAMAGQALPNECALRGTP